ncbi:15695_t:CDS:2 [Funneliformis geosporum]|uniref:15695_t:CDS:1 n=1 Tax=Funneliformis geosporum TaxID=1117311 RepID=A0A9W4T1B4_9GLOM|nr:15695_t:CDS:2 [Funneliformis geosporum]
MEGFETGSQIDLSLFEVGDKVKITGTSKGKGTAGVIKKYHFSRGRMTHGGGYPHRLIGSMGGGRGTNQGIPKGVFIPQKDTEILVEKTLELVDKIWKQKEMLTVLEIGTGCAKNQKFDIIISNPPYVSDTEYENISESVRKQPKEAVFLLIVEIGHRQKEKVIKLVIKYFAQMNVSIFPDWGAVKQKLIGGEDINFRDYFTLKRSKQVPKISKFCDSHTKKMDDYKRNNKGKGLATFTKSASFRKLILETRNCNSCKTQKQKIVKSTKLLTRVTCKASSGL